MVMRRFHSFIVNRYSSAHSLQLAYSVFCVRFTITETIGTPENNVKSPLFVYNDYQVSLNRQFCLGAHWKSFEGQAFQ